MKEKLEKLASDIQIVEEQKQSENEKMEGLQSTKEKLKNEIDDITSKIEEVQNLSFESSKK